MKSNRIIYVIFTIILLLKELLRSCQCHFMRYNPYYFSEHQIWFYETLLEFEDVLIHRSINFGIR